jgi:hypothetical protein
MLGPENLLTLRENFADTKGVIRNRELKRQIRFCKYQSRDEISRD